MSYRELEVKVKIRHVQYHTKIIVATGVQVAFPIEIFQVTHSTRLHRCKRPREGLRVRPRAVLASRILAKSCIV